MRLIDETHDEANALATIAKAIEAGARYLDTARAYPGNELLVAKALFLHAAAHPDKHATPTIKIITKCGMARPEGRWEPNGRASAIVADARASVADLGGNVPDVLLLHAPDPNAPFATSLRALARARDEGLAKSIGLSNITRKHLDVVSAELGAGAIAAIEVALGPFDDAAARGGLIAWCKDHKVPLFAYSALGGPTRASRLLSDTKLRAIAKRHEVTPHEIVIAYLLAIDPVVVPIVGARRPDAAMRAILVEKNVTLDEADLSVLDERFPGLAMARCPPKSPTPSEASAEVVIIMGLTGSGKSRLAESWAQRGYERLNRDTIGGTLKQIASRLGELLDRGTKRVVLDNTYTTRAVRSEVIRIAHARGALVRCIHVVASSSDAQVNITSRMLEKYDALLGGVLLAKHAKDDANLFGPSVLFRMEKVVETPSIDEGFASLETIAFERIYPKDAGSAAIAVPIELVIQDRNSTPFLRDDAAATVGRLPENVPLLLFGWKFNATDAWILQASTLVKDLRAGVCEIQICPHPAGPPTCWCRPPLPGLWLAFARRHRIDPRMSLFLAATSTHRAMAKTLGVKTIT